MEELSESDIRLLELFSCALRGENAGWKEMPERNIWKSIYHNAEEHKIFPMVMESIGRSNLFVMNEAVRYNYQFYLKRAEVEILTQAQRSADFLLLYDFLLQKGLKPLVMKGIVCRSLYPEPEHRPSSDEDLLILTDDFPMYHQAMLEYGMQLVKSNEDIEKEFEVAYTDEETLLYIEIHKYPFPPESSIFGSWNQYIDCSAGNSYPLNIYGTKLYTLEPTSHLIYLILHAFKHFLYGGFGIRQIADIVLFSGKYRDQVNWARVELAVNEVHAQDFLKAIYKIASKYLWDDIPEEPMFPRWSFKEIDEKPLLLDIIKSGVYGASTMSRLHSSNMTLSAVENNKKRLKKNPLLSTVFLPLESLDDRYPYLRKAPYLLPVAWIQRIWHYGTEIIKESGKNNNAKDTIALGNQRIELLKYYKIIK